MSVVDDLWLSVMMFVFSEVEFIECLEDFFDEEVCLLVEVEIYVIFG